MVDVALVKIWNTLVGAVRWDEERQLGYFEYDRSFVRTGWELSPLQMPLSQANRIFSFPALRSTDPSSEDTFKGLPGLLADSLPDRYGNQLINTWLVRNGRPENSMNPVEKLCFIGQRGMGALEFEPTQNTSRKNTFSLELDQLVDIAKSMLHERESFVANLGREEEKAMQDILKIGTSAGGARPKAVIAYHPKTQEIRSGQGRVPRGFEHWLIKLDGVSGVQFGDSAGWGRVEYAYYLMATACGIQMSPCRLYEENGRAHFLTRRFDREENRKHHTQTLCGLQHYDYTHLMGYSYEQVFHTMRQLRLTYPEAEEMYRRMVFNVLATNYDDHTKNFSFLLERGGRWKLAPAYDVCFSYDPDNLWVSQQTLSVNGKRTGITPEDLMTLAKANSIKRGAQIIEEVNATIKRWHEFAARAAVPGDLRERIEGSLNVY